MTLWHVLDARSIWIREFAAALAQQTPVCAWTPRISWTGLFGGAETVETLTDPAISLRSFPLQRGYARFPISALVPLGPSLKRRLERQTQDLARSPLVCTTPYYAPVAELWRGPVVYYQTDLTVRYAGVDPSQIRGLDERLCRRADVVCPNSDRVRDYMLDRGCAPGKLIVIPNATRQANVLPALVPHAGLPPADASDLPRPIAGVIGNLAANMDWVYLRDLVRQTPEFSWLFVGPTSMAVPDREQSTARDQLINQGNRVRFLGARPYGALQSYARSFDVAVLPYRKHEPTYSGSSTRFYEHLAACRPMLATRGFAELLEKEPLLRLSDTPDEAADYLAQLLQKNFVDGQEQARWDASRQGTWEARAQAVIAALALRWLPSTHEQNFAPGSFPAIAPPFPDPERSEALRRDMKTVIVHRGSRDGYQAALALAERGLLECLVTDLYWPGDRVWARQLERLLPAQAAAALRLRFAPGVQSKLVKCCWWSGLVSFALDRLPAAPFRWRQQATRWTDRSLGTAAGRLAKEQTAALVSYSYYGRDAFLAAGPQTPKILFQLHPHPESVRQILRHELAQHPDCASSLSKEWELSLPEIDFQRLAEEARMAQHWIAASSFTRTTLEENGISGTRVHVIPYGVDPARFRPARLVAEPDPARPLRLLFVGTLNQRKGIKYLLQALDLLAGLSLEVTMCGRPVDDLALLRQAGDRVRIRPSVSARELLEQYQQADLFVFPSVAEGFGQVLLEAMACGLPVLSTTNTAAPDLVREGVDGFVVHPRRPDLLAQKIAWADAHRSELRQMGCQARARAEQFTQARFRAGIAHCLAQSFSQPVPGEVPAYV